MKNNITLSTNADNLYKFLSIFGITSFKVISENEGNVAAIIGWKDSFDSEDFQEIIWKIQNILFTPEVLELCYFLRENQLVKSDKIILTHNELQNRLCEKSGWDKQKIDNAIQNILEIKVDMIDDGKITDFFFIHF